MKNPLQKIIADYPDNKVEFEWKNEGQLTHIIVDGLRLRVSGLSRSIFSLIQHHDVSLDEELYRILKELAKALVEESNKIPKPAPVENLNGPTGPQG